MAKDKLIESQRALIEKLTKTIELASPEKHMAVSTNIARQLDPQEIMNQAQWADAKRRGHGIQLPIDEPEEQKHHHSSSEDPQDDSEEQKEISLWMAYQN